MRLFDLLVLTAFAGCTAPAAAPPIAPPPTDPPLVVLAGNDTADGPHAVPLTCVFEGTVLPGPECHLRVPAGAAATVPGAGATTLGAPVTTSCPASDATAPAWKVAVGTPDGSAWGHLGQGPVPGWRAAGSQATTPESEAPVRAAIAQGQGWPFGPGDTAFTEISVVLAGDLDGDPGEERLVRAFRPSDDPDKPGNSAIYVLRDDVAVPLVVGDPLNGVADVLGAVPAPGGSLVLVRSTWSGGQGLHAFLLAPDNITLAGAWECGS